MEFLLAGEKLQRCRTAFLSEVRAALNVLIVGERNGRFLVECRRSLPDARSTCVVASPRMLDSARKRLEHVGLNHDGVDFVRADALVWTPGFATFDLIVTHFFLDCFRAEDVDRLVAKLSQAATSAAYWLLADFRIPPHGLRRYRARLIHWMMYSFFRVVTRLPARSLTPPEPFLEANGFGLCKKQTSEWGLLHTDFWKRL